MRAAGGAAGDGGWRMGQWRAGAWLHTGGYWYTGDVYFHCFCVRVFGQRRCLAAKAAAAEAEAQGPEMQTPCMHVRGWGAGPGRHAQAYAGHRCMPLGFKWQLIVSDHLAPLHDSCLVRLCGQVQRLDRNTETTK